MANGPVGWISDAREADEVLGWMRRSLPAGTAVATTNPPLVFLKTGLQTVAIDDPGANWGRWQRLGVRYLAALRPSDLPDPALGYSLLHRSSRGLWVLEMKLN